MIRILLLLISTVILANDVAGDEAMPRPNWGRATASAAAHSAESRQSLAALFRLAREGRDSELLSQVRSITESSDLSAPERDRVLFELAVALGDFEPGVVGPGVLEFLADTRSLALVPHEEGPGIGVPLYNIRAAAAGALVQWARAENSVQAPADPTHFPDVDEFVQALRQESGMGLAARIREARNWYGPAERELILLSAPGMANIPAASVVLAELAPELVGRPAVDDLLFGLLDHPKLGASAALLLGSSGDEAVLDRLADQAAGKEGLSSRRASLAIDVYLSGSER